MSPEQARGAAQLSAASDLYSLGATAYFALTGRPPFVAASPLGVLHAHLTAPVTPPSAYASEIPPGLDEVVVRLLAKEPSERYTSALALEAALAALAAQWTLS